MGKNRKQKKKNGRPSRYYDLTHEDLSLVRWLASQGATQDEMASHFNVNERTFRRWRDKADLTSIKLNSAIVIGQSLHGQPIATLAICLLEELDRWESEWDENIGIKHGLNIRRYLDEGEPEKLARAQLHCFGLEPESPEEVRAWMMLYELSEIQDALRQLHVLQYQMRNTPSWNRYSNKERLRWDLIRDLHAKSASNEKKHQGEGSDETSQDTGIDEPES